MDGVFAADRWDGETRVSPSCLRSLPFWGPLMLLATAKLGSAFKSHLSLHGVRACEVITSAAASLGFLFGEERNISTLITLPLPTPANAKKELRLNNNRCQESGNDSVDRGLGDRVGRRSCPVPSAEEELPGGGGGGAFFFLVTDPAPSANLRSAQCCIPNTHPRHPPEERDLRQGCRDRNSLIADVGLKPMRVEHRTRSFIVSLVLFARLGVW